VEAMPLDQHIEGGHGEGEPRLTIRPDTVHEVVYLYAADNSISPSIGYNLPVALPSEGTLP
jgi:hypothetical protein